MPILINLLMHHRNFNQEKREEVQIYLQDDGVTETESEVESDSLPKSSNLTPSGYRNSNGSR